MVARGEFLEYARVFGKHSLRHAQEVARRIPQQRNRPGPEIDVQGAAQVKQKCLSLWQSFILPPLAPGTGAEAAQPRNGMPDEEIARRLAKAKGEIELAEKFYDFCVVNDDVERAGREAQAIVTALRCSSLRRREVVKKFWDHLEVRHS